MNIRYYLHGEERFPGFCNLYLGSGGFWMRSLPSDTPWTSLHSEHVPKRFLKEISPEQAKQVCNGREIAFFGEDV
jgi:hypothetical protein